LITKHVWSNYAMIGLLSTSVGKFKAYYLEDRCYISNENEKKMIKNKLLNKQKKKIES